ncbi:S8 family serine peptidase [Brevibacillus choshinensis]|uniref:S8 family serine peptidase n=1 Tax=Brevibacillus choshinensis TaxID=54911 RepID=A0ABX7FGT7_BRECH|nr:S8 family serine peptidase [Brevibacillus choshinensis]QRG65261.1 S8 family serine peptidase [Brevibacillus choshinensis]
MRKVNNKNSKHRIKNQYLVGFKQGVDEKEQRKIVKQFGGKVFKKFRNGHLVAVQIDDELVDDLLNHELVEYIDQDVEAKDPSATEVETNGHLMSSVYNFWQAGFTGRGVKVALIDTGMTPHPDLPTPLSTWDVVNDTTFAEDVNPTTSGHGTKSAGVIAARRNGTGVVGVAYECDIHIINCYFQKDGDTSSAYTSIAYTVDALEYAATLDVDVVLCNVQLSSGSSDLQAACDALEAKGIPILAAAGNYPDESGDTSIDTVRYPGHYEKVVAVGAASRSTNAPFVTRASYSGTGAYLDIMGWTGQAATSKSGGITESYTGTSCATPYTTGMMALIKQAYPTLSAQGLRDKLYAGVNRFGTQNEYGRGLANLSIDILPSGSALSYPLLSANTTEDFSDSNFNFNITGDFVLGTDGANSVLRTPPLTALGSGTSRFTFQLPSNAVNPTIEMVTRADCRWTDVMLVTVNGMPLLYQSDIDTGYVTHSMNLVAGKKYLVELHWDKGNSSAGQNAVYIDRITVNVNGTGGGGGGQAGESMTNPIILSGSSASVNIATGGQIVYFKYVPATDGTYTFDTDASFDMKMELLNSAGGNLYTDDDSDGNLQPRISYPLIGGNTYFLKCYAYSTSSTGSFTLNVTAPSAGSKITEDFEDTSFNIPFTGDWVRVTTSPYAGSYCYRNADISHSGTSQTTFNVNAPSGGTLEFYYRTDSETGWDKLTVTAGANTVLDGVSGISGVWTKITYTLPAGTTLVTFKYAKDGSVDGGTDSVYIDNVSVSGSGVTVSAGSGGGSVPSAPSLSYSAGSGQVTLSISGATGATSYDVYKDGSFYTNTTSTSPVISGLTNGVQYSFYVIAKNSYGNSPASNTVYATPTSGGSAPSTPSLTVGSATTSSLTLTYSASGATSYDIYRSGSLISGGRTSTSFTDSGLSANTTYSYYVIARNSYGSATSSTRTGTTLSSGGGGVTPTTIIEDFEDTNYNFTFTGVWSRTSGISGATGSGSFASPTTLSTEIGTSKNMEFTVNVPTGATTATLRFDALVGFDSTATPISYLKVYINNVLKLTLNANNGNWYMNQQITLGTGAQTIRFESWRNNSNSNYTRRSYIDQLMVSWS